MIELGICSCENGVWADEELVDFVWSNPLSFEGFRKIRAPRGSECMIQDTLYHMRLDLGLSDEEAEALLEEDTLDEVH